MKNHSTRKGESSEQQALSPVEAYRLAESHFRQGDLNACERICHAIIAQKADDADALHLLGVVCARTGRLASAQRLIERAIAIRPRVSHYRNSLENLRRQLQRVDEPASTDEPLAERKERTYSEWVRRFDTLDEKQLQGMRRWSGWLRPAPLISVLLPTYNSDTHWLRQAIESVLDQTYIHWQLCIADDASTDPRVRKLLDAFAAADSRIHVHYRRQNGHISAASNSALELAEGDYVALLDHDDVLARHALFLVARIIVEHPRAALIYSDEDKLSRDGQRRDPYFKPDWNPDLLLSQNFISHLGVYHTGLVRELGGFREGLEGAQDHDLALRVSEQIEPSQIHHIPHVLYHWRVHDQSTAASQLNKGYVQKHALRAIEEHLDRRQIAAEVSVAYKCPDFQRVRYALPQPAPLASLIIPTRNRLDLLRNCIGSLLERTRYPHIELIVIDNESDDPNTLAYLQDLRDSGTAKVIPYPHPFNYSRMNNLAAKNAAGQVLVLLNNDIETLHEGWLEELVAQACRPEVGAVGARLLYPDNRVQHAGVVTGIGGVAGHLHRGLHRAQAGYFGRAQLIQGLSAVTGACLALRKQVFEAVGGFNERDLPVAFNDIDLCLKIRRQLGLRVIWTPYAEALHLESASRGRDDTKEKKARFTSEIAYMQKTWGEALLRDPAYNPNLTLESTDCALAFPPRVRLQDTIPRITRWAGENEKLVFLHVPKTAGTSLRNVLQQVYGDEGLVVLYPPYSEEQLSEAGQRLHNAKALYGHLSFGIHEHLGIEARYVAFLRDPVQRVLSLYGHMARNPNSGYYEQIRAGMTLEGLLESVWQGNNHMVRILSGHPGTDHLDDEQVLDLALENIERHFAFVGISEEFEASVDRLAQHLEWPRIYSIPWLNSKPDSDPHSAADQTLERIRDYNRLDLKLYQWVRQSLATESRMSPESIGQI